MIAAARSWQSALELRANGDLLNLFSLLTTVQFDKAFPWRVGGWPTLTLSNADSPQPGVPRPSSAWVGGETLCQPESLSTPPTSKIPATRSFHMPKICTPDASGFPQPAIIETAEKISKGRPEHSGAALFHCDFPLTGSSKCPRTSSNPNPATPPRVL